MQQARVGDGRELGFTWRGRPLEALSREELLAAVRQLARALEDQRDHREQQREFLGRLRR